MEKRIPQEVYENILEYSIIGAVDAIILHKGKVLLGKRTQKPVKGEWWIPGGRQKKGELPEETVRRKVKEEVGLDVKVEKFVGVYDVIFNETASPNVKTGVHYIARAYIVTLINSDEIPKLDETQSEYRWIDHIEEELHDYVKVTLKDSGVFS